MLSKRTDLAVESKEIWAENAEDASALRGVRAREEEKSGFSLSWVEVLDEEGARALEKPEGRYFTLSFDWDSLRDGKTFNEAAYELSRELHQQLRPEKGQSVLAVCLGNGGITPDSVGPRSAEHILATRHLSSLSPELFGSLRPVSVLSPGVLGSTGLESAEVIAGVVEKTRPGMIIAIDALASRKLERVCTTVQIADSGIVPGSGVGNSRKALNRESLGVPVISVGTPTVVDVSTLVADLADQWKLSPGASLPGGLRAGSIVTPRDIDSYVERISRLIGMSINLALQSELSPDDITALMS